MHKRKSADASISDIYEACIVVHSELSKPLIEPIPLASHQKAVVMLLRVRSLVSKDVPLSAACVQLLTCAGVAVVRRVSAEAPSKLHISLPAFHVKVQSAAHYLNFLYVRGDQERIFTI
tara:strand:- start:103 stop:459 length:357 start_codon:yes stop_codon:yes gene_type:complete